jgi:hypothetical protein
MLATRTRAALGLGRDGGTFGGGNWLERSKMTSKLDIKNALLYIVLMTNRRYQLELWAWIAVYTIFLILAITLLDGDRITGIPARTILALLPMVGGFGIVNLCIRRYQTFDEFQQKLMAESLMFAFGSTAVLTFGYGFLQRFVGAPELSWFFVWGVLGGTWIVGRALTSYRYR